VGGYVPTSADRLEFRPGLFLQAIATGRWLVLDEINRAEIDKAVGELFTVLSGQRVDLPYRVEGQPVRILPFADVHPEKWVPAEATGDYDYVVHPSWRTLATMNVYDRSSLFGMSFAFMRRFAFVDVGVPDEKTIFAPLRARWVDQGAPAFARGSVGPEDGDDPVAAMKTRLSALFEVGSPLMHYRELGPAIAKDMIRYTIDRAGQEERPDLVVLLAEAFLLYAVPQLDGLTREAIVDVYGHLTRLFPGEAGEPLAARLRALYPHVSRAEWPDAVEAPREREDENGGDV
jgi:MoxR-like ATPase